MPAHAAAALPTPDEGGRGLVPPAAPLTVAAVAARLGVAASTLRTWDRRYGLGPSEHVAGSHRRYSPDDLARLETMRALIQRGVAPADAARIAARSAPGVSESAAEPAAVDSLSLAAAAVDADESRVRRLLRQAVGADGLLGAYTGLVRPALAILADTGRAERPGHAAVAALSAAMFAVVREHAAAGPANVAAAPDARDGQSGPTVLVLAADGLDLAAHVLAQTLAEQRVVVRVGRLGSTLHREGRPESAVVAVVGPFGDEGEDGHRRSTTTPVHLAGVIGDLAANGGTAVVVGSAGATLPEALAVHRVRTLTGAVPEVLDLAGPGSDAAG